MRISDWSSDVCSSDLKRGRKRAQIAIVDAEQPVFAEARVQYPIELGAIVDFDQHIQLPVSREPIQRFQPLGAERGRDQQIGRASCRERGGQYVSTSVVG